MPQPRHYRRRHTVTCACARSYARWSAADLNRLLWLADQHRDDPQRFQRISRALNRTPRAVQQRLLRLGCPGRGLTLRAISRLLQVHERVLLDLIAQGRFVPGLVYHDRPAPYRIQEDNLWAWMENMASWHFWHPHAITEPVWRAYFADLRHDWLTAQEVAAVLHLSRSYVHRLRAAGHLPGRKVADRAVWYHRRDVEAVKSRLDGCCYVFADRRAPGRGEGAPA